MLSLIGFLIIVSIWIVLPISIKILTVCGFVIIIIALIANGIYAKRPKTIEQIQREIKSKEGFIKSFQRIYESTLNLNNGQPNEQSLQIIANIQKTEQQLEELKLELQQRQTPQNFQVSQEPQSINADTDDDKDKKKKSLILEDENTSFAQHGSSLIERR